MSGGTACFCRNTKNYVVTHRNHNHSAFNGYHKTHSDYSTIECIIHNRVWRSKAKMVDNIPNAKPGGCNNAEMFK